MKLELLLFDEEKEFKYQILIYDFLESYREDFTDAKEFFHGQQDDEQQFYINMKSGAESGWDYSTKWCVKHVSIFILHQYIN